MGNSSWNARVMGTRRLRKQSAQQCLPRLAPVLLNASYSTARGDLRKTSRARGSAALALDL